MPLHALELVLDAASDALARADWDALAAAGLPSHVTLAQRMPTAQVGDALAVIATGPAAPRFVTATGLRRWDPDAGVARLLAGHSPAGGRTVTR